MILRTLATLAVAATTVVAAPIASSSAAPAQAASSQASSQQAFPAGDGPMGSGWYGEVNFPNDHDGTMLHADVLLPGPPEDAPQGGWPMIISGGPYFSCSKSVTSVSPTCEGPVERFADFIEGADIFANGYGWAQVDTRGYGSSANCNDYGGIGEQTDMASAVDFFGSQDYSSGKVGLWGKSYDAWTQVMAIAQHPEHLAAAVIQAPLIEGYRLAWDNGVHWDTGWYATTSLYMLYDNEPIGTDGDAQEHAQSAESTARAGECWPENQAAATAGFDRTLDYWVERNLIPEATKSMVPTFWTMGFQDVNTKPTNLLDVFSDLPGYHKGWFGHWDHVRGNEVNREDFFIEVMDFLEVNLKDQPTYELPVNLNQQTRIQTNLGDWYAADTYPPSDVQMFEMTLNEGSYVDDVNAAEDEGIWSCTPQLPYTVHFSGEPIFHVQASPELPMSNLLTRVYAIGEDGRGELIARGAALLEEDASTGQGSTVSFNGWPSDFVLEEGSRLGVLFTSQSVEHNPVNTGGNVEITAATVELPFRTETTYYDEYTDLAFPPYAADLTSVDFGACEVDWEQPPENASVFLDTSAPAPALAPAPAPAPETEPASAPLPATGGGLALAGLALVAAGRTIRKRN